MNISRVKLSVKNTIKANPLGKKARDLWQMRSFTKANAEKTFDEFCIRGIDISPSDKDKIVKDMLTKAREYRFGFDEYFMYHFYNMPFAERRSYVSDRERIMYCERMNNMKNMIIFDDKAKTYEVYGKYYKRDLIEIFESGEAEEKKFASFVSKHPKFIIKPFDGACGIGIKIINVKVEEARERLKELLKEYPRGFVAEELIVQTGILHDIHPESVNTLRIPTIKYEDRTEIIHPILRCGRGSAVVDNGGAGGICCAIDVETGIVKSAADEKGNYYTVHPDTAIPLVGLTIPKWDEAKNLVKELANVLPDNHYTGWDLALTEEGWVLQEANDRGTFILFQITERHGFREEIERIVHELGV